MLKPLVTTLYMRLMKKIPFGLWSNGLTIKDRCGLNNMIMMKGLGKQIVQHKKIDRYREWSRKIKEMNKIL